MARDGKIGDPSDSAPHDIWRDSRIVRRRWRDGDCTAATWSAELPAGPVLSVVGAGVAPRPRRRARRFAWRPHGRPPPCRRRSPARRRRSWRHADPRRAPPRPDHRPAALTRREVGGRPPYPPAHMPQSRGPGFRGCVVNGDRPQLTLGRCPRSPRQAWPTKPSIAVATARTTDASNEDHPLPPARKPERPATPRSARAHWPSTPRYRYPAYGGIRPERYKPRIFAGFVRGWQRM